ncbi:hypothetical protein J7K07_04295 [Candidatus Bathyarchaeota archaeon]|nr:hypothetical protein [Candidatus Bathyarchaeota archaeon]
MATKWVIALLFILLIAYSGFVTYNWLEGEKEKKVMMSYAIAISDIPLRELSEMESTLEYLREHNAEDLLKERISKYQFHARTLYYSSSILYTLTQDEKYQIFRTTMRNLESFLISVNNKPNTKEIIENNINVLKQMGRILNTINRIDNLTLMDAENLLKLSEELKY